MMDIRKLNTCMEKLNFYNYLEFSQQHPSIRKKYEKTAILRFPSSWPISDRQTVFSQRPVYFFS